MDHFKFDQNWKDFAAKNGLPTPSNDSPESGLIEPLDIDFSKARPYQAQADAEWAASHPLSSLGYISQQKVHDIGSETLSVKVSCPSVNRLKQKSILAPYELPVMFVTHGGGWVSGSHVSEEAWLLWPLYAHLDLIIISVEYRLAPEHKFPTWVEDSWEVLDHLFLDSEFFTSGLGVSCDMSRLILAGSSAGATITASLAQRCRDMCKPLRGVVLNVPALCHYKHFPHENATSQSYQQCKETYMGSREMATCWNTVMPDELGGDPLASPLLGETRDLPPHLIFVAGRDCLRDEGLMYAAKLEESGIATKLHVYNGVPHNFAHFEELESTVRFWEDLKRGIEQWI